MSAKVFWGRAGLQAVRCFCLVGLLFAAAAASAGEDKPAWKPAPGPLMTPWGEKVTPQNAWRCYPRPQMKRADWVNLNGLWELAITPRQSQQPQQFPERILVPFPVQSRLSGVKKDVSPEQAVWYRRRFRLSKPDRGRRVLLHFGAVDWETQVWVNGRRVGSHRGGYDPFWFDVTEALRPGPEQEIVVRVWDPTDRGYQPRGKQVLKPRGIWYTAVTGIWQTVWLETVPRQFIRRLKIVPRKVQAGAESQVDVLVQVAGGTGGKVKILVRKRPGGEAISTSTGPAGVALPVVVPQGRLWSPEDPFLYQMEVIYTPAQGGERDRVQSYFALRTVQLVKDAQGRLRLGLNGRVLFQYGPLDQGWWPDGLYTPPSDQAMLHDLQTVKRLGMNMIRKHVKVEPDRWYYHCDHLGILVWQDMPNGDRHIGPKDADLKRSPESAENYRRELRAMVDYLHNHPSVVLWVPFNEGWGQFDTAGVTGWLKQYDPTRLVISASGWTDRGTGDAHDIHRYPGPAMPPLEPRRAAVLGEFGGLGLPLPGHLWWNKRNWGYRTYRTREELQNNYVKLMQQLVPLVEKGLAAAVYTQLTDVEGEVNGLMTYDRRVLKFDPKLLRHWSAKLYRAAGR